MVQQTPAVKQVNVAATATDVDGVKLKNRNGTDQCLPPAMLFPKQEEWLWQDRKKAKANGDDIPAAKKRQGQPPPLSAKRIESTVATQKRQISSLTNKKMIVISLYQALRFQVPTPP